jgi:DNA-directed RNA polymerase specialized sigma24 family protein
MDSIHDTMERIYRLFEKHGPKYAGGAAVPLVKETKREMVHRLRHDPEVKERVLLAFSEGKTPRQVAAELKLPEGTVGKWSQEAGFKWPIYRPPTAGLKKKNRAAKMLAYGLTPTQVAEKLRLPVGTVCSWSSSWGLSRSRQPEAAK